MKLLATWALCALLFLASCKKKADDVITPPVIPEAPVVTGDNDPLTPGNPTQAQSLTALPENYLKDNGFYKLAYSRSRGIATWVAWHLESGDVGSTPRQDDFRGDSQLPIGWYQVQTSDYTGTLFDRGHNCPSGDRTLSLSSNSSTFLMTNIIPQAPNLNQGPWAGLEDFTRNSLVGSTNEAFIYMGNTGHGGYNSNGIYHTIANGAVTVPAKVWKVVLIIPKGNSDLSRIHSNATVLAVNMPNNNSLYTTSGQNLWRNYITTINALEADAAMTGVQLDFLRNVADSIKGVLKTKLYQ
ncbi:MAG TPA: DNA/RNA non-specific endonuclease [Chitinophagaceae bacterium]|nr:DNA/RNA non-specific endonuclease [Chitinophagaceae bacterium]